MGKIKETILKKSDRRVTEPKPPSTRRIKRMNNFSIESAHTGRVTLAPSRVVNLRGLRRRDKDHTVAGGTFTQVVPEMAIFRFKKTKRPTKVVINEHYSDGKSDKVTEYSPTFESCRVDDSVAMTRFERMVNEGLGKIEIKKRKVIHHHIDKQDKYFKFNKHDVRF